MRLLVLCAGAGSCLRLDHTMELIFFKLDTTEPTKFCTTPDGKIDFCLLGRHMGLEPGSITLCGDMFPEIDYRSDATWMQIKELLRVVGTLEDPVVVSGRPIPEVPTGMFDLNLTKKQ